MTLKVKFYYFKSFDFGVTNIYVQNSPFSTPVISLIVYTFQNTNNDSNLLSEFFFVRNVTTFVQRYYIYDQMEQKILR